MTERTHMNEYIEFIHKQQYEGVTNKKWHAENFKTEDEKNYEDAGGGFVWPEKFMPDIVRRIEYGNLFAYLYRRFGIPSWGSDDHKEIANWYITTPDPAVALRISPKPNRSSIAVLNSGINHNFGYVIDTGVYRDRRNDRQVKAVEQALSAAMLDLLSPVFVRDVPIDAAGCVLDGSSALESECDCWEWAGYGVHSDYFKERYPEE